MPLENLKNRVTSQKLNKSSKIHIIYWCESLKSWNMQEKIFHHLWVFQSLERMWLAKPLIRLRSNGSPVGYTHCNLLKVLLSILQYLEKISNCARQCQFTDFDLKCIQFYILNRYNLLRPKPQHYHWSISSNQGEKKKLHQLLKSLFDEMLIQIKYWSNEKIKQYLLVLFHLTIDKNVSCKH